jgi:hypothetical protein
MSRPAMIAVGLALLGAVRPAGSAAQDTVVGSCADAAAGEGTGYRGCSSSGSMMKVVGDCRQLTPPDGCWVCGATPTRRPAAPSTCPGTGRARFLPLVGPVPWPGDVSLVPDRGRLCAQARRGRRIHRYPTGALLLRDRAGTPAFTPSDRR